MSSNINLAISIIKYLREESKQDKLTPDTKESLEVAVQCLQTAYDIDSNDIRLTQKDFPLSLEDIFNSAILSSEDVDENSPDQLKKAATMKNLGNSLMKSEKFADAVRYYTAAIELDNRNAIYYGNRAAAYCQLSDFKNAVADCEKAIEMDPKYAKAYGRLGLAYSAMNQHEKAIEALKKAVELDPDNESYQCNLRLASGKEPITRSANSSGVPEIDWGNIFGNPVFRNMASTLMQDPNIMTAIEAGMSAINQNICDPGMDRSESSDGENVPLSSLGPDISAMVQAGQILAAQMQARNPQRADRFRATSDSNSPKTDNKDPQ